MGNTASRATGRVAKEVGAAATRAGEAVDAAVTSSAGAAAARRGAPAPTEKERAALSQFVTRAGELQDAEAEAARRAKAEAAAIHARVNKRIGMFRRLDDTSPLEEDGPPMNEWDPRNRSAAVGAPAGGRQAPTSTAEEEEEVGATALARRARLSLSAPGAAAAPRLLEDGTQVAGGEGAAGPAGSTADPWSEAPGSASTSLAAAPATRKSLAAFAAARAAARAERDAAEAQSIDWSALDTKPNDPAAAEVAAAVLAQQAEAAAGEASPSPVPQAVSVRRVRTSSDAAVGMTFLHDKSEATISHVTAAEEELGAVISRPADDAGTRSFALYEAMQLNPLLLDTPEVLARSPAHMIAAQLAAGILPPLALPASARPEAAAGAGTGAEGGALVPTSSSSPSPAGPSAELVAAAEAVTDALAPHNATIDELLLRGDAMPRGVAEWGPRPPESSPYDQLILAPLDAQYALSRSEIFELFARHRADPDTWTPARLAALYDTKLEWVEVLLQYAAPPTLCQVDGEPYGVYEVRSLAQHPAASSGSKSSGSGGRELA